MPDKIGVGIIGVKPGVSWSANGHIPALRSLADYEVRAVSTTRQESAEAAARHFGIARAFDDNAALAAAPEVDLVVVAVRVPSHCDATLAALEAGKPIYCEWPLARNLAEAELMAERARARSVRTIVGLQARSAPLINYVRDLVGTGYIGDVLSTSMIASGVNWGAVVDRHHTYTIDPEDGATLLSIAVGHAVDTLCYCLSDMVDVSAIEDVRRPTFTLADTDGMPTSISATRAQIGKGQTLDRKVADQIAFVGRLDTGAVATVHFRGGLSRGTNLLWEINGTEGDLRITGPSGLVEMMDLRLSGGRHDQEAVEPMSVPAEYDLAPQGAAGGYAANLTQAYVRLARDLRTGTKTCPSFEDAVKTHRILDAISRSARTGRRVVM